MITPHLWDASLLLWEMFGVTSGRFAL
jgi:hypothetical protein